MKTLILFLLLPLYTLLSANQTIGNVQSFQGNVKIKHENSIRKSKIKVNQNIEAGDLIITAKGASVSLKLADNSTLVMDALSTIHFTSLYQAEQNGGKVLYKITSRDAKNSLKITTPFAVIGIKGTTFIVNATQESSVSLKEGLIGITSIQEAFELYRKNIEKAFDEYKHKDDAAIQQHLDAFEAFKKSQSSQDEVKPVITKEFDLKAGNRVSFNGNKVHEDSLDLNDDAEFTYFDNLLQQMH